MTRRTFFRMFGLAAIVAPVARVVAGISPTPVLMASDRAMMAIVFEQAVVENWGNAETSFRPWKWQAEHILIAEPISPPPTMVSTETPSR